MGRLVVRVGVMERAPAPEASAFATDELTGRRVGLEFDVERIDQFDWLLAYV
jgi:hypothetical protein